MVKKIASLIIGLIILLLFGTKNSLAVNYDMSVPTNWNIRIDGASASDSIGLNNSRLIDLNGNGIPDLIVPAPAASFNGRSGSGGVYIIYDSILSTKTGTANVIDLSSASNYNIRIDGAAASDAFGRFGLTVGDLDKDGLPDLIISAANASNNSRNTSGSVYVIYGSLIKSISGTGNSLDMATSSNYNLRFDGELANCNFGYQGIDSQNADFDGDGKIDLAIGSSCDFNSRANSGSLYLIYNSTFSTLSGIGNNIDLSVSGKYNLRIDGAVANDRFAGLFSGMNGYTTGDLNGDGNVDLIAGADGADYNTRNASGSLYVFYNSFIRSFSGTGNTIDLSDTSKFNIRIDGAVASNQLGTGLVQVYDLNKDGNQDILFSAPQTDFNSRTDSGSVYYMDHSIFASLTGTGNTIDLSTSTNYTFRVDGAAGSDNLGLVGFLGIGDYNSDSLPDLFIPSYLSDNNTRTNSGSAYLISNSILFNSSTIGRTYDLSSSSNYTNRYDGASGSGTGDRMFVTQFADANNDGVPDFIFSAYLASSNSLTNSGSIYIVYNFPNLLTQSSTAINGSVLTIKGNLNASNSITNIAGVEYSIDTDYELATWNSCAADDGTFSGSNENFICTIPLPQNDSEHVVYVRGYDTTGVRTAKSKYLSYRYNVRSGSRADYLFLSPLPVIVITKNNVISIATSGVFKYDAYLFVNETPKNGSFRIPGTNYWQVGPKEEAWWRSWFNGANILSSQILKPFTIILKYDLSSLEKNIHEKSLKLAYSPDGQKWKIIPSILDTNKKQLITVTKNGGYYMVVGGGYSSVPMPLTKVKGVKTMSPDLTPVVLPTSIPTENKSDSTTPKKHCFLFFCW